jgi:hypothetical protein
MKENLHSYLHSFELLMFKPFYYSLHIYIKMNKFKYSNLTLGSQFQNYELEQIKNFRNKMYQEKNSYLIAKTQFEQNLEEEIDFRSYHSIVYNQNNQIVAVSRFTPYPFEITAILGKEKTLPFKNYLEISRLVCLEKHSGIGTRLLVKAGLYSIVQKKYDGFIAICRDENRSIFQKFGLKSIYQFNYSERGSNQYHFICADFFKISTSTFKYFKNKFSYKKIIPKN